MFQTFETSSGPAHVATRVAAVRALLAKAKLDAVLVPRADEHQGEYVPPSAERLQWLTGFTGSAGLAIVAKKTACLFIDGRYTVQAKVETDTAVFEVSLTPRAKVGQWLIDAIKKGGVVGYDPWLHTTAEITRLTKDLAPRGIKLKPLARNLINSAWGKDRPQPPTGAITLHPDTLAGKSAAEKIADLQKTLKGDGDAAAILTLPDSICWLFNIRGNDVAHNPVVLAFAIVPSRGKPELFVAPEKLTSDVKKSLSTLVRLLPPKDLKPRVKALKAGASTVRIDPNSAAQWFIAALGKNARAAADPCILPKAIKSRAEITGCRTAHERDGAAVVRFLSWLDAVTRDGTIDEITAVKRLEALRAESGALREISFATIAGSGPNGAIVHYRVSEASNRRLRSGELFLIDSGAQYQDGTTDITRTIAIGTPSPDMRRHFTAVLKGHIAVATALFPVGTRGIDLDPFARRALWQIGCDYDHGTGHGIGSYLSVHEGPQSISRAGIVPLQPGMLLSNEPGYYAEGKYGIRIENVVLVHDAQNVPGGPRPMMSFETLTLAPIDRRLIHSGDLEPGEITWLNAYHARVFKTLSDSLDAESRAWLRNATAPL